MFGNLCKNKSGTVSVHVLQIRGRNNVLVKSLGSSSDVKEIERLLKAAHSDLTIKKAHELVKTKYALTYTNPLIRNH